MRNVKLIKYKNSHTPVADPIAFYMHKGWTDFRGGLGFPKDYDTWPQPQQVNYEIGRRCAAIASTGGKVPAWASNHKCPVKRLAPSTIPAWSAEIAYNIAGHAPA